MAAEIAVVVDTTNMIAINENSFNFMAPYQGNPLLVRAQTQKEVEQNMRQKS